MKKVLLMAVGTAVAAAILPASAGAASAPTDQFSFTVSSAQLSVASLQPITVDPAMLTAAGAKPISFNGKVGSDGTISVPKDGVVLPSVTYPVPKDLLKQLVSAAGGIGDIKFMGFDIGQLISSGSVALNVRAGFVPVGATVGSISRETGEMRLTTPVDITVSADAVVFGVLPLQLIGCSVKGLSLDLKTNTTGSVGSASLSGSPYNDKSKAATLAGVAAISSPACDSGFLASYAAQALPALTGSGSQAAQIGLALSGQVVLPPVAVASVVSPQSLKLSSSGSLTAKIACTKARACRGVASLSYPGGAVMASKPYSVPAGKTQTVVMTLGAKSRSDLKAATKGRKSMAAVVKLSVDWGSGVSSPLTLVKPASWRG